jgi:cold-inducible RNA-binding protein
MSKKMFVGNLSFQTTESDVRSAFEKYGTVESVAIITDRDTGRSKGFGFVEMSEEDANKAIAGLSGSQLNGRALTVNEAKPMVKKDFGGGGSRGGGGGRRDRY